MHKPETFLHFDRQPLRLLILLRCNVGRGCRALRRKLFLVRSFGSFRREIEGALAIRLFLCGAPVFSRSESATLCCLEDRADILFPVSPFVFCRFINARRRIVQPMIDQSNRAGKSLVITAFKLWTGAAPCARSSDKQRISQNTQKPHRSFTCAATTAARLSCSIILLSGSQYTRRGA